MENMRSGQTLYVHGSRQTEFSCHVVTLSQVGIKGHTNAAI